MNLPMQKSYRVPVNTTLRDNWSRIRKAIAEGTRPNKVVLVNAKTGYSIMDNVPQITCAAMCPIAENNKCYDLRILNMRPNVMKARMQRHALMLLDPAAYIEQATREIEKLVKKGVEKIRIYTGGDFSPKQMPILTELLNRFPSTVFYMISKAIRNFKSHAETLLTFPNFFLNLSEMADFEFGAEWNSLRDHPRVNSVYTLRPEEDYAGVAQTADIVFNVSKKKADIAQYKAAGLALCPCDSKDIPAKGACAACGLCATKGGVRGNNDTR